MSQQANIKSLDSLQAFQQQLVLFIAQFNRAFESIGDDLKRTQGWLEVDQRQHWDMQVKKRQRMLDQAKSEMLSARMSEFVDSANSQQMALRKWKTAVEEAEEMVKKIRYWSRQLPQNSEAIHRATTSLRFTVESDMKRAVAQLEQVIRIVEDYLRPGGSAGV